MDTRTSARLGVAIALSLLTLAVVVLGLWSVYGLAVEYGGGSFADLAFLVVPFPLLAALVAVVVWPRVSTRTQVAVVLGTAVVMVGGGLAADALGRDGHRDRLVEESRTFSCNGPHAEITVPAAIDETWQQLPRESPIYGPIEGSRTDCVAGVSGDGEQAFLDYTAAFRDLEGWQVRVDQPQRFVMVRDDVRVTVRLLGAPDRLTTIRVGVVSRAAVAPARRGTEPTA